MYQDAWYLAKEGGKFKETMFIQVTTITSNFHRKTSHNREDQEEIYLKDTIRSRKGELWAIIIIADLCPALVIRTTIRGLLYGFFFRHTVTFNRNTMAQVGWGLRFTLTRR